LVAPIHKLQDGNALGAAELEMPLYFSMFEIGTSRGLSAAVDNSAGWNDEMFSEVL
jgi:hypothetical protein